MSMPVDSIRDVVATTGDDDSSGSHNRSSCRRPVSPSALTIRTTQKGSASTAARLCDTIAMRICSACSESTQKMTARPGRSWNT